MSQAEPVLRKPDLLDAILQAVVTFLRAAARAVHSLWLEVTGFLFLVIGVVLTLSAWREYQAWAAGAGPGRLLLAGVFAAVFVYWLIPSRSRSPRFALSTRPPI
jgi:protein-S-isoprenylcysteine O-methyltransferase Ste14